MKQPTVDQAMPILLITAAVGFVALVLIKTREDEDEGRVRVVR